MTGGTGASRLTGWWRTMVGGGSLAAVAIGGVVVHGRTHARAQQAALPIVTVYKDPACGCCRAWVERMRAAGFDVRIHDVASASSRDEVKQQQGVTPALAACHTAVVGGYVVEGHVPPELVKRMLAEHPKIAGLAVPGMPAGSPGMEGMGGGGGGGGGGGSSHYDVLAFTANGATRIYASPAVVTSVASP